MLSRGRVGIRKIGEEERGAGDEADEFQGIGGGRELRKEVMEIRVSKLTSEIELLQSSASVNAELADLENVIGQERRGDGGAEGQFGGEAHFWVVIASYELRIWVCLK